MIDPMECLQMELAVTYAQTTGEPRAASEYGGTYETLSIGETLPLYPTADEINLSQRRLVSELLHQFNSKASLLLGFDTDSVAQIVWRTRPNFEIEDNRRRIKLRCRMHMRKIPANSKGAEEVE